VWKHTAASLSRIVVGFGRPVVVSLLLALGAFVSRTARGVIHDVVRLLNATSSSCGSCISIIWFGLSAWAPIFTTS